ncbi:MAG: arginase family protein [Saprospiraceae bacterium]
MNYHFLTDKEHNMTTYHSYRANPLVRVKSQQGQIAAQNSLTGVAYRLSDATLKIYKYICDHEGVSLPEIEAAFPDFTPSDIEAVVNYFHTHKLLLVGEPEDLDAITKKDVAFFDLPDKQESGKLCLVGIPFGSGNPLPNSCSSASDNLRLHIREKKLSLNAGNIRCNEVTNELLGIKEDYPFSAYAFAFARDLGNMFLNVQHESQKLLYERIYRIAKGLFKDTVPLFIGGDHSISYSTIRAAAAYHDKLCIIHFDAHTDTYSSARSLLAEDGVHNHGNFVSKCMDLDQVQKVYQFGIRGDVNLSQPRSSGKQEIITCRTMKQNVANNNLLLTIPSDWKIYITIDIDVLDPEVAPATASPVPNGLSEYELLHYLRFIYDSFGHQIVGYDLVEISPHLYNKQQNTAISASHILLQIIQRYSYDAATQFHVEAFENYPFLKDSQRVIQHILDREKAKFEQEQTKDFAFLSANLQHFMPHLSEEDALRVYMQIHLNRSVMMLETQQRIAADWLTSNANDILDDPSPKIYCTYHLGAYRAPIALMIKHNVSFVLLLDNKTITGQAHIILSQIAAIKQRYGSHSDVQLVNAEVDNVIFKLREAIKQGYSILAYIDGNTGKQGVYHRDDKYQVEVPFLAGRIMARTGIAAISWLTQLPIYPIITYRPNLSDNKPVNYIAPPVLPDRNVPLNTFSKDATIALYHVLEKFMPSYYEQWEPWFYVHRYLPPQSGIEDTPNSPEQITATDLAGKLKFNQQQFALFKIEQECYMLDKEQYLTYPLEDDVYQTLKMVRDKDTTHISRGKLKLTNGLRFNSNQPSLDSHALTFFLHKKILLHA